MIEPRHKSCDDCKPSTWTICPVCSRYYCKHNGGGVCWACLANPQKMIARVETVYAGPLCAVVWRTEYGAYRSQTWPGYYRKKDGLDMLEAAKRLGLKAHLQERPHYSKWRDWYGRSCGYSDPEFFLWVEMDQTTVPAKVGQAVRSERNRARVEVIGPLLDKPRSEWTLLGPRDVPPFHGDTVMNYIKKLEAQRTILEEALNTYCREIVRLEQYLASPKFHEDTTVQVQDIFNRLGEIQSSVGDVLFRLEELR